MNKEMYEKLVKLVTAHAYITSGFVGEPYQEQALKSMAVLGVLIQRYELDPNELAICAKEIGCDVLWLNDEAKAVVEFLQAEAALN